MDSYYANIRAEISRKIAIDLSDHLSLEGVRHFRYTPSGVNEDASMISDSYQPYESARFENLVPIKWDVVISHFDEDGTNPFALLRIFDRGNLKTVRIDINNMSKAALTISESIKSDCK